MAGSGDELFTVAEVANRLRVNEQTVRNWIDRGELGGMRLGARRVRVPASELTRYLAESTAARRPTLDESREEFDLAGAAVQTARAAGDDAELAGALRRLARPATALARVVSR